MQCRPHSFSAGAVASGTVPGPTTTDFIATKSCLRPLVQCVDIDPAVGPLVGPRAIGSDVQLTVSHERRAELAERKPAARIAGGQPQIVPEQLQTPCSVLVV